VREEREGKGKGWEKGEGKGGERDLAPSEKNFWRHHCGGSTTDRYVTGFCAAHCTYQKFVHSVR